MFYGEVVQRAVVAYHYTRRDFVYENVGPVFVIFQANPTHGRSWNVLGMKLGLGRILQQWNGK